MGPSDKDQPRDTSPLPVERHFELQLHLDRLRQLQEECSGALRGLRSGTRDSETYRRLLSRYRESQRAWDARNRELFGFGD